jgi:hypothetical protein
VGDRFSKSAQKTAAKTAQAVKLAGPEPTPFSGTSQRERREDGAFFEKWKVSR